MQLLNAMLASLFAADNKQIAEAARKDPVAYRDTKVFAGSKSYRYYEVQVVKGLVHRFCYTKHRNVAGYFLTFTETIGQKTGRRSNYHGTKTKKDAIAYCKERYHDAKKPKAERKYVLPTQTS